MNATGYTSAPAPTKIKGYKNAQLSNFTPQQMQLLQQLLGGVGEGAGAGLEYLTGLASGDEEQFKQMEAPAMRQFQEFLGQAGTRFSGLGARDSSAFENHVAGAGADLAKRQGLQQNAIEKLLGYSSDLLNQRPYENLLVKKQRKPGFMDYASSGLDLASKAKGLF